MQHDTPDDELKCACHLLDRTTGNRAKPGTNGHKWILLSQASARSPEGTAFGTLREEWRGTTDPRDFNAKIQLVEDNDRAADHLADQLSTLIQEALRRQGRKTDARYWEELRSALTETAKDMMEETGGDQNKGIRKAQVPNWIRRELVCMTTDKMGWDMRLACPKLDRAEILEVMSTTHKEVCTTTPDALRKQ